MKRSHRPSRAIAHTQSTPLSHALLVGTSLVVWLTLALALLAGCATTSVPAGDTSPLTTTSGVTPRPEPVGTPWKSWFVFGTLEEDDEIRLQDDFYSAVNRQWLLEQNRTGDDYTSATDERLNQIADQMYGLMTGEGQTTTDHDLENLRRLLALVEDWEGRDADGIEPLAPLVDRLRSVDSLDELTAWLCSEDARLSCGWRATETNENVGLFRLCAINDVSDESGEPALTEGYTLIVEQPTSSLAPLDLTADDLADNQNYHNFLNAAATIELADYLLVRLGVSEDDSLEIVHDAQSLDAMVEEALADRDVESASHTREELEELLDGDFPLLAIADAYGYGDASTFEVEDVAWLEALCDLYCDENVHLFVAHELVGLCASEAQLLDGDAYDAVYYYDGYSLLPEDFVPDDEPAWYPIVDDDDWLARITQYEHREAIETVEAALPTSYAKVYVAHFFDEATADEVRSMAQQVTDEYELMLADEEWLGDTTREAAIDKLKAIRIEVGHPDTWGDTSRIAVRTRDEGATLFDEVRRLRGQELDEEQALLRDPDAGILWTDCMDVNAYYEAGSNTIYIGAGILGGSFWDDQMSFEEKLGATGVAIGHEISHAFDSDGAYLDKYGAFNPWWTDEDLDAFEERVDKVVSAFQEIDPIGIGGYDGSLVCAEAIADLGGIRVTDRIAAKTAGFDYDAFFRAYARSWASVMLMDDAKANLADDVHPFDRDRTNVPLRELDSFQTTYDIKEGDGMWLDPARRISVW